MTQETVETASDAAASPLARDPGAGRLPLAVVALAVGLGAWLRLRGVATAPFFGDEYHSLPTAELPPAEILGTFDEYGSHVPLPLLQHAAFELLGPSPLAARLPALVPGLATLFVAFSVLRRFVGTSPAALATFALALNPLHVHYSQFARAYALAALAGLALVPLARSVARRPRAATTVALALVAGSMGWIHLASGGFVAAVALVAFLVALLRASPPATGRARLAVAGAFALAAILTVLLHLPALPGVRAYLESHAGQGAPSPVGPLDVATIVAGSSGGAWIVVGLIAASLALWRHRPPGWPWIVAAVAGPIAALALGRPVGMAYAWARYLIVGLPFLLAWAAWSWHALGAPRVGARATLVAGVGLVALGAAFGPLPRRWTTHPFSNSYLALHALPAFDERWPGASPLYTRLATDESVQTIVEAPQLVTRAVLLLRQHRAIHGKDVLVGWVGPGPASLTTAYVRIDDADELASAAADVLIFHTDPRRELERYWTFVFEDAWLRHERDADRSFMERHRALWTAFGPLPGVVQRLRDELGPPFHEDGDVVAWRLR